MKKNYVSYGQKTEINKFVIDASLINTEKINLEVEKNNLLTVD